MKADYVHKDSKTINDEIVSYKITMPLIDMEELQRIDNHYNELVDEFTKQFVKEKDMIIAQRIMMNLRKENKLLLEENQKLKELQCTFQGTGCQNKMKKYKELMDILNFIKDRSRSGATQETINKLAINFINNWLKKGTGVKIK